MRALPACLLAALLAGCAVHRGPLDHGPAPVVLAHGDTVYTSAGTVHADGGSARWLDLLAGPRPEPSDTDGLLALAADPAGQTRGFWLSRPGGRGLEAWHLADDRWSRNTLLEDLPAPTLVAVSPDGQQLALGFAEPAALLTCDPAGDARRTLALPEGWKRPSLLHWLPDGALLAGEASGSLVRYEADGTPGAAVTSLGKRPLRGPVDACDDGAGGVFLLDALAGTVTALDVRLQPRTAEPLVHHLRLPRSLCLDGDGQLVLSQAGEGGLRVYNRAGALLYRIPARLAGEGPRLVRRLDLDLLAIDGGGPLPRLLAYRPEPGTPAPRPVASGGPQP